MAIMSLTIVPGAITLAIAGPGEPPGPPLRLLVLDTPVSRLGEAETEAALVTRRLLRPGLRRDLTSGHLLHIEHLVSALVTLVSALLSGGHANVLCHGSGLFER